jgi:hypothetical protein
VPTLYCHTKRDRKSFQQILQIFIFNGDRLRTLWMKKKRWRQNVHLENCRWSHLTFNPNILMLIPFFVTILDMSLISRSCKNDHIKFNVGTQRRHDTLVSCAKFNLLLNRKSASIYRYLMRVTLSNLVINDPSNLKLQSRDQNLI